MSRSICNCVYFAISSWRQRFLCRMLLCDWQKMSYHSLCFTNKVTWSFTDHSNVPSVAVKTAVPFASILAQASLTIRNFPVIFEGDDMNHRSSLHIWDVQPLTRHRPLLFSLSPGDRTSPVLGIHYMKRRFNFRRRLALGLPFALSLMTFVTLIF